MVLFFSLRIIDYSIAADRKNFMGKYSSLNGRKQAPVTVSFAEKFLDSAQFYAVFQEGMALVEEASGYLDSIGRQESKELDSSLSFAYATESMRLTTRLMQVASWLLIKRAVNEGEMTSEEASKEEDKLNMYKGKPVQKVESFEKLPQRLQDLVDKSFSFLRRMQHIDEMMQRQEDISVVAESVQYSPVNMQMAELELAFGSLKKRA